MVDRKLAETVLACAEHPATPGASALQLLRTLIRLRLDPPSWEALSPRVVAVLDRVADSTRDVERIAVLAAVPHPAARERLAQRVSYLQSADTGSSELQALASVPLPGVECEEDDPLLDPLLAADDPDVRLWAAVVAARAGRAEPLLGVLDTLADAATGAPPSLAGDPRSVWEQLHAAHPLPRPVQTRLVERWESSSGRDQRLVIGALTGRWDADARPVADPADPTGGAPYRVSGDGLDDLVLAYLDAALRRDLSTLPDAGPGDIERLDPKEAGAVVGVLLDCAMSHPDPDQTRAWCDVVTEVAGSRWTLRLPVPKILARYAASDTGVPGEVLGNVLGRVPVHWGTGAGEVVVAIVEALVATDQPAVRGRLADLLEHTVITQELFVVTGEVSTGSGRLEGTRRSDPGQAGDTGFVPMNPPIDFAPEEPAWAGAEPLETAPPPAAAPVPGEARPPEAPHAPEPAEDAATPEEDTAQAAYEAFPRLDCDPVVVARTEFTVTVGLGEFWSSGTTSTGVIRLVDTPPVFDLEVELIVDPTSLTIVGPAVRPLHVTEATRFPSVEVTVSASTAPGLLPQRSLRALFRHQGAIVGFACRSVLVVDTAAQVAGTPPPAAPEGQLLALAPLLAEAPPDLVLGVFKGDQKDTLVWDAYPLAGRVSIPDVDRRTVLDGSASAFATSTRRLVAAGAEGVAVFDNLVGVGHLVAGSIPVGIRKVLRDLVAGRPTAPSVLLLTEEAFIPWELAVVADPPLTSSYAGQAPFLGAQLALSRWPLASDAPPVPHPPWPQVTRPGVLTAEYDGVANWERLPAAESEAADFVAAHPAAVQVAPVREDVIGALSGRPPVDLLHVALHGQFDATSMEDGLVLLEPDGMGGFKASFLTSLTVLGLRNQATRPFVFLNACQVGAGNIVLASYAGFAAAVLMTGATGVVAPLWNVTDELAARLTGRFYGLALPTEEGQEAVPVAEVLRRFRAELTREAVVAAPTELGATQLAYQFFGHPAFTLHHTHTQADTPATPGG